MNLLDTKVSYKYRLFISPSLLCFSSKDLFFHLVTSLQPVLDNISQACSVLLSFTLQEIPEATINAVYDITTRMIKELSSIRFLHEHFLLFSR